MNFKFLKLTLLIIILFSIISCSSDNEDNNTKSGTDIKLVTGINIRNSEFSQPIQLGNPNILTNNQFIIYPNPTLGLLRLKSNSDISDVWIIPAKANKSYQKTDFTAILTSEMYNETLITSNAEMEITDLTTTNLTINLNELNYGYYRVFVKINGKIYWDNIYFQDNNMDIEDLNNYWN